PRLAPARIHRCSRAAGLISAPELVQNAHESIILICHSTIQPDFMARAQRTTSNRRYAGPAEPSPFEQARDELFQHIMRCGVVGSDPEHQQEWFSETMAYFKDRYPELAAEQ